MLPVTPPLGLQLTASHRNVQQVVVAAMPGLAVVQSPHAQSPRCIMASTGALPFTMAPLAAAQSQGSLHEIGKFENALKTIESGLRTPSMPPLNATKQSVKDLGISKGEVCATTDARPGAEGALADLKAQIGGLKNELFNIRSKLDEKMKEQLPAEANSLCADMDSLCAELAQVGGEALRLRSDLEDPEQSKSVPSASPQWSPRQVATPRALSPRFVSRSTTGTPVLALAPISQPGSPRAFPWASPQILSSTDLAQQPLRGSLSPRSKTVMRCQSADCTVSRLVSRSVSAIRGQNSRPGSLLVAPGSLQRATSVAALPEGMQTVGATSEFDAVSVLLGDSRACSVNVPAMTPRQPSHASLHASASFHGSMSRTGSMLLDASLRPRTPRQPSQGSLHGSHSVVGFGIATPAGCGRRSDCLDVHTPLTGLRGSLAEGLANQEHGRSVPMTPNSDARRQMRQLPEQTEPEPQTGKPQVVIKKGVARDQIDDVWTRLLHHFPMLVMVKEAPGTYRIGRGREWTNITCFLEHGSLKVQTNLQTLPLDATVFLKCHRLTAHRAAQESVAEYGSSASRMIAHHPKESRQLSPRSTNSSVLRKKVSHCGSSNNVVISASGIRSVESTILRAPFEVGVSAPAPLSPRSAKFERQESPREARKSAMSPVRGPRQGQPALFHKPGRVNARSHAWDAARKSSPRRSTQQAPPEGSAQQRQQQQQQQQQQQLAPTPTYAPTSPRTDPRNCVHVAQRQLVGQPQIVVGQPQIVSTVYRPSR